MSLLLARLADGLLRGSVPVERIQPAETGEAGEVGVARIELGPVLDGDLDLRDVQRRISNASVQPLWP